MSALAERLTAHYSRFEVTRRVLLTGHSHQAWPDVAREGQLEAFDDAAEHVDGRWRLAAERAERVRVGVRRHLGAPDAELVLGASTHELVLRFLSCLDLAWRPHLVTTDGEFHTLRRQLARLDEAGLRVRRVPAEPVDTLAERLGAEVRPDVAAVLVSTVLYRSGVIVPHLQLLAEQAQRTGTEVLLDAYHGVGVVPFSPAGLECCWVVGGGYKYLQYGEGNCWLRMPPQAARVRPVITGWFAELGELSSASSAGSVAYPQGVARLAGATYDPTSHYRAARVVDFFDEQRLTPALLRRHSMAQLDLLRRDFDALDLPTHLVDRDRDVPREDVAGFLALRSPVAGRLQEMLRRAGVHTDHRGDRLPLGPAPYVSDDQLVEAVGVLGESVRELRHGGAVTRPEP